MEKETLEFPQELLIEQDFVNKVIKGITTAESVGSGLREVGKIFSRVSLGKNPAPEDVSRLTESLGAMPAYWSALEIPFKSWLADLAREGSELAWKEAIREAALDAFGRCVDARDIAAATRYKAIVEAERYLYAVLRKQLG